MEFEWDSTKVAINLEKHNIDFVAAVAVFDDPYHLEEDSTKPEYGEMRGKAIGVIRDGRIITVVFTDREGTRRIISARRARRNERRRYNQGKTTG